ncbi:hypothetical protein BUALT_Bualt02G0119100 [Buddleja alternifolia]|uniref:Jacalin-type lectin domain-containing protein n=1 Tax=Buddleja alternifolia TaxID=168488 RepID=A0AAV6Y7H6_9LAMI|nr:hypothetical protein BUALT_Bualt02G0119100 [Buddleja alternifolia]
MVHMGCEKNPKAIGVVPWGGPGGNTWDDGTYDGVREITLIYGSCISTIQVIYDKNCKPVSGEKHGTNQGQLHGTKTAQIKLRFPEEFLTTVTGHYALDRGLGTPVIRSLTFKTNQKTFGPYGVEEGTPFSFSMEGGKVVGFKGRSGWYMDAIGFHIVQA